MNYGDGTLNHVIRNFDLCSLGVRTQLSYSRTIASRDRGLADRVGNRTADILDDGTTTTTKSLAYTTNSNLYVGRRKAPPRCGRWSMTRPATC
jgi:hypothetical protein